MLWKKHNVGAPNVIFSRDGSGDLETAFAIHFICLQSVFRQSRIKAGARTQKNRARSILCGYCRSVLSSRRSLFVPLLKMSFSMLSAERKAAGFGGVESGSAGRC